MKIEYTFKHMESTEAIKEHFIERAERIQKLLPYEVTIRGIFEVVKTDQLVEVICRAEHKSMTASAHTKNMYESIDEAIARLETQIKKDRDRKKGQNTSHIVNRPGSEKLASDVDAEIPHRSKKAIGEN